MYNFVSKFEIIDERDDFLEKQKLSAFNQEDRNSEYSISHRRNYKNIFFHFFFLMKELLVGSSAR